MVSRMETQYRPELEAVRSNLAHDFTEQIRLFSKVVEVPEEGKGEAVDQQKWFRRGATVWREAFPGRRLELQNGPALGGRAVLQGWAWGGD